MYMGIVLNCYAKEYACNVTRIVRSRKLEKKKTEKIGEAFLKKQAREEKQRAKQAGQKVKDAHVQAYHELITIPFAGTFKDQVFEKTISSKLLEKKLENYIPSKNYRIVVVVTSYNNANWYERNLASIYGQDYENYSVLYIDDASPDGTSKLVTQYVKQQGQDSRTVIVSNKTRLGANANWYYGVNSLPSDVIVVAMDGDDWYAKKTVLSLINKIYNKYDVLVTYGSSQIYPYRECNSGSFQISKEVIKNNAFRQVAGWSPTQLRTFKAGLFHRIKKEDFMYEGKFIPTNYDCVQMFPMLEMAGFRSMYIPDVLYIYNQATAINDFKVFAKEQSFFGKYIRQSKEKYSPLPQDVQY